MAAKRVLTAEAKALFRLDLVGIKNELAQILTTATEDAGLDREGMQALQVRKQVCQDAVKIIREEIGDRKHDELAAQLQQLREAMKHTSTGETSFNPEQIQLPRKAGGGITPH